MKRMLVRYRTTPDKADDNRRLIEGVFAELRAQAPDGLRYAAFQLPDDGFAHLVEREDGAPDLPSFEAFRRFLSELRDRCAEPPALSDVEIVGDYRMLRDR